MLHLEGHSVKGLVAPTGDDLEGGVAYCGNMPPRIKGKDQEFGPHFIRQWRKYRGYSLDALADKLAERVDSVSKSSLSRIETREQPYSQPILEALAWALDCSESDLLERDLNDPTWKIIDKIKRIRPEARPQVADILDTFTKV